MMTDQQPTELAILLKIVEVIDRRLAGSGVNPQQASMSNVVNNFIASISNLTLRETKEIMVMRDSYATGQAGAVGPQSSGHALSFTQVWDQSSSVIDLQSLALELNQVRSKMRSQADGGPEQDLAISDVARAELAAKSGDGPKALEYPRHVGSWALDIAKSLDAEVVVATITRATGV
jgi:hypothetical protein